MRYDPAQGYVAQGVPDHPVGTRDELDEKKLPTKVFQCCAEPSNDGSVKGCPHWWNCTMSYKGLPAAEGGGPRAHCWELIKSPDAGGGIVHTCQPCFWGVPKQDEALENGAVLRVIADEGETYEMLTEVPDPEGGKDQNGFKKWDKKMLKCVVPNFQRLGEEQKLAKHELRANIMQQEQERIRNERASKNLGIEGSREALDKRGRRIGARAKKEE